MRGEVRTALRPKKGEVFLYRPELSQPGAFRRREPQKNKLVNRRESRRAFIYVLFLYLLFNLDMAYKAGL